MKLGTRKIGADIQPFVIAEMSGNHNQSLEHAFKIIDAAAAAGAHALKIQTYTADTMTIDCDSEDFVISDPKSLWKGEKLYNLYQKASTPWEWHEAIFKRCAEKNIIGFSTPFDETSLAFLESLNVPFYKIASFENTDLPLLKKIAQTKKPVVMSTGMMTLEELSESVQTLRDNGCKDIVLLKCTSTYPASPDDSHLRTIPEIKKIFNCEVGVSDHTLGVGGAIAAVALGATVIEKHVTLKRADGGVDSVFSLEPEELQILVVETERAWRALGDSKLKRTAAEEKSLGFRRSLYIVTDMAAGEVLTKDNLRCIRPGFGLAPKYYEKVLGKKLKIAVKRGTRLSLDLLLETSEK